MTTKTYTAKTPIDFNNKHFEPNDPIELDDKKDAPALLAVNAIEEAAPKKVAAK